MRKRFDQLYPRYGSDVNHHHHHQQRRRQQQHQYSAAGEFGSHNGGGPAGPPYAAIRPVGRPFDGGGGIFAGGTQAIPESVILRWIVIGLLIALSAGMIVGFSILQARDQRRAARIDDRITIINGTLEEAFDAAANLTAPPNCTLEGNATVTSVFPDDLFTIFNALLPTNLFQFDLAALGFGSNVTLTTQDESGTVALLTDIPPVITVFQDDQFRIRNTADPSKELGVFVGDISPGTTRIATVQNTSGVVALTDDLPMSVNTFADDVFAVLHAAEPTSEVMLDVSQVASSTTRVMTVQPLNGTIAYLENITGPSLPFTDDEFAVANVLDDTKVVMLDCSEIDTGTEQTMMVQDEDGTIAYLSDVMQVVEVLVNESRIFPAMPHEGVELLEELGEISKLEISLCGGGGGGGTFYVAPFRYSPHVRDPDRPGAGGGSGSGYENFPVLWATDRFYNFNVTVGIGGAGGFTDSSGESGTQAESGTETNVWGIAKIDFSTPFNDTFYLDLHGYGGGGANSPTLVSDNGYGGAGGGNGGNAGVSTNSESIPGVAGDLGGYEGGAGGEPDGAPGKMGAINYPWRAGGGGGGWNSYGAAWFGSYSESNCHGCGASSMFGGPGKAELGIESAYCAGGSGITEIPGTAADGGGGAVLFRYYIF
jgi:hypothetical protein